MIKRFFQIGLVILVASAVLGSSVSFALAQGNATPTPPDPLITITPYVTPTPTPTKPGTTPTPTPTQSQSGDDSLPAIKSPLKAQTIPELVSFVIRLLFALIALTAVVVIIVAGFRLVVAGANPAERGKAKNAIVWAVIGLLVALMSFSIVSILQKLIST